MIIDVPNSGVALAVSQVAAEKNKVFIVSGAAASDLTGPKCNANTIHWTYDTWMLANGTGKAMVKTGGDTWFFLTADYAFGHALERDTAAVVDGERRQGARQRSAIRSTPATSRRSCCRRRPRRPRSSVLPMPAATPSTPSSRRPSSASSRADSSSPACSFSSSDVAALGLQTAQGLSLTETWYWDANDTNRAWTKRWQAERKGKFPTMVHAGVYAGILHYLKARRGARRQCRRQDRRRQDEGNADRRSAVRQRLDPRRRPQDPRRLSVRGEEACRIRNIQATSTTTLPPSRRRKRSVRSRTAIARW